MADERTTTCCACGAIWDFERFKTETLENCPHCSPNDWSLALNLGGELKPLGFASPVELIALNLKAAGDKFVREAMALTPEKLVDLKTLDITSLEESFRQIGEVFSSLEDLRLEAMEATLVATPVTFEDLEHRASLALLLPSLLDKHPRAHQSYHGEKQSTGLGSLGGSTSENERSRCHDKENH